MDLLKIWLSLTCILFSIRAASFEKKENLSFSTKSIKVQAVRLKVAVADSPEKRAQGLMFVENWDAYQGMIFVFEESKQRSFWMRNTLLPLSLGFYDADKKLSEIQKLNPAKSLAQTVVDQAKSHKPARYVLEVPQGWFEKNKIQIGSGLEGL